MPDRRKDAAAGTAEGGVNMCVYRATGGICKKFSVNGVLSYCVDGPCPDGVLTNADRIRSMTDEELAEWLTYPVCAYADCNKKCPALPENNRAKCDKNILEWLQRPAKEG